MNITSDQIEKVLKLLAKAPRRIASLSNGLDNSTLSFKPDEETWSANEILAHLRACEDVRDNSIIAMLSQEHPTLRHISPRTWIKKTDYPKLDFYVSLKVFTKQRNDLLKLLKPLKNKDWLRGATFTGITKGRDQTVFSYVNTITQHENDHCTQIEDSLKKLRIFIQ